jgi:hypothetical protein
MRSKFVFVFSAFRQRRALFSEVQIVLAVDVYWGDSLGGGNALPAASFHSAMKSRTRSAYLDRQVASSRHAHARRLRGLHGGSAVARVTDVHRPRPLRKFSRYIAIVQAWRFLSFCSNS